RRAIPTNGISGVGRLVRTAIDAIAKLQNQDNLSFAFSSPLVKCSMEAGAGVIWNGDPLEPPVIPVPSWRDGND
ncbi:MAG: hypothetical protein ABSH01_24520, partial [Terriglobia bacterium]